MPWCTRLERDQRVVDDEHAGLGADASHDAAHDLGVPGPVGAGDAEADRVGHDVRSSKGVFHDVMEDLLHFELARRLQVGAAAARPRQDDALPVREEANRLRTAGIEAEDMNV